GIRDLIVTGVQTCALPIYGTQNSGTESEAWAGGGWLSYQSGWLLDAFAIGATMYGSAPLYAPADKDGTLLLGPGQKAYYALGEEIGRASCRERVWGGVCGR